MAVTELLLHQVDCEEEVFLKRSIHFIQDSKYFSFNLYF